MEGPTEFRQDKMAFKQITFGAGASAGVLTELCATDSKESIKL